jgi:predicted metal-dependent hydrolase
MDNDKLDVPPYQDLPRYSLRVSVRAKRMQLRVNHWGKVEVVVPRNVSIAHVAPFVHRHRKWLERALAQIQDVRDDPPAANSLSPEKMSLLALGEDWELSYRPGVRSHCRATTGFKGQRRLLIETVDGTAAHLVLQAWLHDYARQYLPPWLRQVSEECQLPFTGASVRAQKTRWGSCSARGHINLNRHLIFLPPHLVRYIMVHELCHTVHLNHSRRYWTLVGRFAPDFEHCEAELRLAARHIPLWACPE